MTSPSREQMETLLSFLEEHSVLARGVLRSVKGRLQSQRLWGEICATLNAMGKCCGCSPFSQYYWWWTINSSTIHKMGQKGHVDHGKWFLESLKHQQGFVEQSEILPPSQLSFSLDQPGLHIQESKERCLMNVAISPSALPNQRPSTLRSTRMRRERRVRSRAEDSVRRKFFHIEEQRAAQEAQWTKEFAGIRATLTDLYNVVRQGLTKICEILRGSAQKQLHQ